MTANGSITVAGFSYGIFHQSALPLVFETGFEEYLSTQTEGLDRKLIFKVGFISIANDRTLYQARTGSQLLWEIIEANGERWFHVYHPQNGQLQQQAHYNRTERSWTIHCMAQQIQDELVINPLAYPMAPLLWYVLSTEEQLLLIHASGLVKDEEGRVFAGFSGVGKSTLANIWERNGAKVINDDRLIIKKEKDGTWQMYNTPMYYHAMPISGPVNAIYLPFHSPVNSIEKLNGAKALAQLLAFTIHHGYDPKQVLHHNNVAEELLQTVPISKLGVVPTDAIIEFIKANEKSETQT